MNHPYMQADDKRSRMITTILYLVYIWCIKGAFIAMDLGVNSCYPFGFISVLVTMFVTNVTTVLLVLALPIIVLRTFKLDKSTLFALAFVTVIALFAMVCGNPCTIIWTILESWMLLFAFGLPPLRVFLRDMKTKMASLRSLVRHGSLSQEVRSMKDSHISTPSLERPASVAVETLQLGYQVIRLRKSTYRAQY
ncbi:hypothetical protein RUND412_006202 [Rhizina undulata]